ncbi:uncharacterized protein LOC118756014 [Rhagoletis pomonella]|uniref:uncharacterized protein LOC118756014 n=1 Tax=Rhagoletis pomonella TaxID=28610 RepID=UPI00178656B9|nr:uncharacterized protein LOC118756014 [Rhagoletis pomonella]
MEKECESVLDYDDKVITIIAKLQSREKSLAGRLEHTMNTSSNGAGEQSSHGVKLKSLELKKFDGSFEKWLPFWEQFKPTVHDIPLLSSAAKFNFLSEALVDRASSTIQGFTPTEECYSEAIALLQDEYGNTEKIIEKYVQKLLNLEVQTTSDVQGLRSLYNQVMSTTRTLSALKVTPAQYTISVKSVILKCLPKQMRMQFFRLPETKTTAISTLNSTMRDIEDDQLKAIRQYMKREIEAIETAQLSEVPKKSEIKTTNKTKQGTATSLVSITASEKCIFCNNDNLCKAH